MDEVPNIIEQDEPIYELAIECERLFEEQISRISEKDDANGAAILSELSHRFSIWATFLGVFADEKVCLDRRLRHHIEIQDQVLRVLDLIQGNLAYVFEPVGHPDDSSEQMDVEFSVPTQQLTLSIENVEAVSDAIDRLNQFGIVIRQSSITSQARRARDFTETFDLTSFEEFAYLSLKTLYPTTNEELLDQLTNSMTDTYKMVLYQRSKRQTQSRPRARIPLPMPIIGEDSSEDWEPREPMVFEKFTSGPSQNSIPNVTEAPLPPHERVLAPPQSKPTTLDSWEAITRLRKLQHPSTKGRTASILVSHVEYPLPTEKSNICDWCFSPLPIGIFEGNKWKQHINEDHRPFVCISEKCLKVSPSPRFSTSRKWLEHMLTTHGQHWHREVHAPSQWFCPLCNDSRAAFLDADSFTTHVRNLHGNKFTDSQIQAIVRQSRSRYPRPRDLCPICYLSMNDEQNSTPREESTGKEDVVTDASHQVDKMDSSHKRIKTPTSYVSLDSSLNRDGHQAPTTQLLQSRTTDETSSNASPTIESIASHIAGHLRTIMLLTLRIISTDVALEISSNKQSISGSTGNQSSRIPTSDRVLNQNSDLIETLTLAEYDEVDHDYELLSQDAIPDSEEVVSWDNMRSSEDNPLADDFLRQAVENGAFQSHLGNEAFSMMDITLPSSRKKFVPNKLNAADFRRCTEPWALSALEAWIREMAEGEHALKAKAVEEALVCLFSDKIPTMNVVDAEVLSRHVASRMFEEGVLMFEEEWVNFGEGHISGALWQLTGSGCYAPKLHDFNIGGQCYSCRCTRTLKKVDLRDLTNEDTRPADGWHVFYKLRKKDWESKPIEEVERQNILHEIVTGEENYIKQLDIFRFRYRDSLRMRASSILGPERKDEFIEMVFGKLDLVQNVNKYHLLAQLKYRQHEQGPWITGFSDIFREWVRKAKSIYIEYAAAYPRAAYMMRQEASRNISFRDFLETTDRQHFTSRQGWMHYLTVPLQRLQHYLVLLGAVDRKTFGKSGEKTNLGSAMDEIKIVISQCNAELAEQTKSVELMDLGRILAVRPEFHCSLNLHHLGRELIFQGELLRAASGGVRRVENHVLLFDHFLVLAKAIIPRDERGERKLDVSKEPIAMSQLVLESMYEEPIHPNGIVALLTTGKDGNDGSEGKILYPFKIKHLGHEAYTLYASSAKVRSDWCSKIIEAKTRHAQALSSQNAEPFRLRMISGGFIPSTVTAAYTKPTHGLIEGTPLHQAIRESERAHSASHGVTSSVQSPITCATDFMAHGNSGIAVGTGDGVYVSHPANSYRLQKVVSAPRVTQIAVMEEFSVCLLIADKNLISYPLNTIVPSPEVAIPNNESQRAPQRLAKDVAFFAMGKIKDQTLLIYHRRKNLRTSFKVLQLTFDKPAAKKSRLFSGLTLGTDIEDTFREIHEFSLSTECHSVSFLREYIAIATAKGLKLLDLDTKQLVSIPRLESGLPSTIDFAKFIRDQKPLGMFKLNDYEFLLPYETSAVFVDKHGVISRSVIMEYTSKHEKTRDATMYGSYLLLFNEDYVEVRNAENGRLRQIIPGRDIRVVDFGVRGPTGGGLLDSSSKDSTGTVKIVMGHPEVRYRQIILEMFLDEGHQGT